MALWPTPGTVHRSTPAPDGTPERRHTTWRTCTPWRSGAWKTRGISLRALAKALHHDPSYVSRALRGLKPCGPKLARDIDDALAAGGEIIRAASRSRPDAAPVEHPWRPR